MGPLQGIRVVELVGIGPGPFVGMVLSDMGAEVIAIDRPQAARAREPRVDLNRRGKRSIVLDLKADRARHVLLELCDGADALIEGYRPGVAERLGFGPDVVLERNPALVYGRMTGWGQTGPLAHAAGHDIGYLSITGALHAIGAPDRPPPPPLNLVGDYGAAMFLAFGIVSAILHTRTGGSGQVVDAAMVDGVHAMMSIFHGLEASGQWHKERSSNFLDGGAPYYRTYRTRDGKFVSFGAIEPAFMREFIEKSGAPESVAQALTDRSSWPEVTATLSELFAQKTRQQWCELLEGSDACVAPVIPFWEAAQHPHNRARDAFVDIDGVANPAPAPRLSATPGGIRSGPVAPGADSTSILHELGYDDARIQALLACEAVI